MASPSARAFSLVNLYRKVVNRDEATIILRQTLCGHNVVHTLQLLLFLLIYDVKSDAYKHEDDEADG